MKLDRATAAASAAGQRIVLSVFAQAGTAGAPQDAAARDTYCGYVRTRSRRYPSIRDVVIWNEPNKSLFWTPQLAADGSPSPRRATRRCWRAATTCSTRAFPTVNVIGLALSSTGNDDAGSHSPGAFIRSLGDGLPRERPHGPLLDTVGYHPYGCTRAERPWRRTSARRRSRRATGTS